MKATWIVVVAALSCSFVLDSKITRAQNAGPATAIAWGGMVVGNPSGTPVPGAPYSATITAKSVRTLADGNQIIQTSAGTAARDSQGRTREEPPVPSAPADVRHLAFIQDPVSGTAYTLSLTDKTAYKMPSAGTSPGGDNKHAAITVMAGGAGMSGTIASPETPPMAFAVQVSDSATPANTEDLGSETMEGLSVTGVRTTRTIPAGQIGNAESITIVTEVWTSSDLKTVVSSKRTDPLMGDDTFQLSNISRAEPDPSLFVVPTDFKIVDNPTAAFRQPDAHN